MKRILATAALLILIGAASPAPGQTLALKSLDAMAVAVRNAVLDMAGDLETASQQIAAADGLESPEVRAILTELCRQYRPFSIDCATVDADGTLIAVEPKKMHRVEGEKVALPEIVKQVFETKQPALSGVFIATEGMPAITVEWPILEGKRKDRVRGVLSLLLKPGQYLQKHVESAMGSTAFGGWVLQPNGLYVFSRNKKHVGTDIRKARYELGLPGYAALVERILTQEEGSGQFLPNSTGHGPVNPMQVRWKTVNIYDREWRVVILFNSN